METSDYIDWSQCSLVEVKPAVQSGAPVLRGTRMPADAIIDNLDYGVSIAEISAQFELPEQLIQSIVPYADGHRIVRSV